MIESERFDWCGLIPFAIHPTKVQIVEAMRWIDRPLSATDLELIFDEKIGVSSISYHLKSLKKWRAVKLVSTRKFEAQSKATTSSAKPSGSRRSLP